MVFDYSIKKPILEYSGTSSELVICICRLKEYDSSEVAPDFLGCQEREFYKNLRYDRKRKSYLLGRYAAKNAVKTALKLESLTEIEIFNGIFDQPLIGCDKSKNLLISISHCEDTGIAVAFPDSLSIGIDIEKINPEKYQLLENMLKNSEKDCLEMDEGVNIKIVTMLWAVKEALSKSIKTGLTLSMDFFETKNQIKKDNYFRGEFTHFIQYQYLAVEINTYIVALVYPAKSVLIQDEL